jgi:hypothetical protein
VVLGISTVQGAKSFIEAGAVGFVQGQVPDPITRAGFLLRLSNAPSIVINYLLI